MIQRLLLQSLWNDYFDMLLSPFSRGTAGGSQFRQFLQMIDPLLRVIF